MQTSRAYWEPWEHEVLPSGTAPCSLELQTRSDLFAYCSRNRLADQEKARRMSNILHVHGTVSSLIYFARTSAATCVACYLQARFAEAAKSSVDGGGHLVHRV